MQKVEIRSKPSIHAGLSEIASPGDSLETRFVAGEG
jgi:hypothetical protein